MHIMRQFDAYRKAAVDTSDNVRIVSLLFDGAVNFLKVARGKMEKHDIAGKGIYIGKATAIVGELSKSLNMEEGGEIARNLRRLYDFVLDRLLKANLRNDMKALDEAERVLETLRSGWKEMERGHAAAHVASIKASAGAGMALQA
jgi:flagellar protein FliS